MKHPHPPRLLLLGAALLTLVPAAVSAQTAETTVSVDLTESPPSVTASPSSVAAGSTTFEAANVGGIEHELVVIQTDLAADALPVSGDTVDQDQLDVVADSDPFAGGESRTVTADLAEGNYALICNVPGHYGLGMRTGFTVTAAQADGGAQPGPASTGSGGFTSTDSGSPVHALLLGALVIAVVGAGRGLGRLRRNPER